jgi:hypothetical protein
MELNEWNREDDLSGLGISFVLGMEVELVDDGVTDISRRLD